MRTFEYTFDLIQVVQVVLIFFVIITFVVQRKNYRHNKYFFVFLLIILLATINSYILKFIWWKFPNLLPSFAFALGPSIFFYISEPVLPNASRKYGFLKHLTFSFVALSFPFLSIPEVAQNCFATLLIAHFGAYLLITIQYLSKKKFVILSESIKQNPLVNIWRDNFYFIITVIFVYLAVIIETFFMPTKMVYRFTYIILLLGIILLVLRRVFIILLYAYYQYRDHHNSDQKKKYKASILKKAESEKLAIQLTHLMENEHPFLDEELDLKTLAQLINIHPKSLSQVINENFGKNFFDYINKYRIEFAKEMLRNPKYQEYKIYEIMYEVGFNSRSSFNTAFKKFTQQTAKAYRDSFK